MPKNKVYKGMRQPSHVLNSMGVWVRNKFAGMRTGRNVRISDFTQFGIRRKILTHTDPVVRTKHNDGHNNPTRMRHAATRKAHAAGPFAAPYGQ